MSTPFKLEDLVPEEASFLLAAFPDKEFKIRTVNIEDWTHFKNKYGERLSDILQGKDWEEICAMIFRLLSSADKETFSARDCEFWDDEGNKTVGRIGGAKLLAHYVNGIPEFLKMTEALYRSIGAGKPIDESKNDSKKKTLK